MSDQRQYVTVKIAAAMTGVSARTLRYWIKQGKLPAVAAQGGALVDMADVERLAAARGQEHGNAATAAEPATATTTAATTDVAASGRSQLEAIRDEWLAPLVDRIAELEREAGRLNAELDHARQSAEVAVAKHDQVAAERDELLTVREALRVRLSALEAQQAEAPTPVIETPETATDAAIAVPWWQFWKK